MGDENNNRKLIVLFHGYQDKLGKKIADVRNLAEEAIPDAKIYAPVLAHSATFSKIRAAAIVAQQIDAISEKYEQYRFDEIILMGYSMGAVIARRLLVEASGLRNTWDPPVGEWSDQKKLSKVEPELEGITAQKWAKKISRLILIAGMNRGWNIDNAKSGFYQLAWTAGSVYGHAIPGPKPTIFDIRRGAPFIVQTRLRWLEFMRSSRSMPDVIQLLGSIDEMVSPNDSVDYAVDDSNSPFHLVEIPNSDHRNIINLKPGRSKSQSVEICAKRRDIIRAALTGDNKILRRYSIPREYLDDELPPPADCHVKDVVFVIHGIRDRGYWTKWIAARIKSLASQSNIRFVSRTPSYGYFPILPFLLPWYRRQKVEWLMDQYVETKASYPEADFHYMGHSNGTYLGARSLIDYPAISFKRIMFAGSVVRRDYPWRELIKGGRVNKIYNAVATRDFVVALFPYGLRLFKDFFDLGGAGHRGFDIPNTFGEVFQLDYPSTSGLSRKYVEGTHSAAKQESQWDEIANFIVNGTNPDKNNDDYVDGQPCWSILLGKVSPAIVVLLAVMIVGLLVFILKSMIANSANVFWLLVYVLVIRFIFVRF